MLDDKGNITIPDVHESVAEYHPDKETSAEIAKRFTYHPPQGNQADRYVVLRDEARDLAGAILSLTPKSREQSLALTKLEECVMWANAGIARRE
jgi:hypothetical protein